MFRSRSASAPLDHLLDDLPDGHRVIPVGEGRVVVGPTGAFVVAEAGRDVRAAARRVAQVAATCRAVLASRLAWAPFVDPLVVTDRRPHASVDAAVVSPRLVRETLVRGPRLLSRARVDRIANVLAERSDDLVRGSAAPRA